MNNINKIALAALFVASAAHAQMPPGPVNSVVISPAWGAPAAATSDGAVAIGSNTIAGQTDSGGLPALALTPGWSYADQTAVGTSALSWGQGDSAYGFGAAAISNPAPGTTASATAIGSGASAWGNNSVSLGYHAYSGGSTGGAPLAQPTVVNATAIGGLSSAQADNSTAIGAGATATAVNSVALGAGSVATQVNTVEVGGRRITGVADPVNGQDAVNLRTLQAALAGLGGGDTTNVLNQANAYTDNAIRDLRKEYSQAIAAVAASPVLPALSRGEQAIAVGGGFYNGQQAIGILYGRAISDRALINAGVSAAAGGKAVGRVGAAWKW